MMLETTYFNETKSFESKTLMETLYGNFVKQMQFI